MGEAWRSGAFELDVRYLLLLLFLPALEEGFRDVFATTD
jgi:hypothetical protein